MRIPLYIFQIFGYFIGGFGLERSHHYILAQVAHGNENVFVTIRTWREITYEINPYMLPRPLWRRNRL